MYFLWLLTYLHVHVTNLCFFLSVIFEAERGPVFSSDNVNYLGNIDNNKDKMKFCIQ